MPVPDVPPPDETPEERRRRLRASLMALAGEGGDVAAGSALAAPEPAEPRFDRLTSGEPAPDAVSLEPFEFERAPELGEEPPDDATEVDMDAEEVLGARPSLPAVSDAQLADALAGRGGTPPQDTGPAQSSLDALAGPSTPLGDRSPRRTSLEMIGGTPPPAPERPAPDLGRAREALTAITGEEIRPYSPDQDLEDAQARDRRRGAAAAILRALGAAGVGIAAAKGRPEFMPLATGLGGGLAGVLEATGGQARDVMVRRESEAKKQAAEQAQRAAQLNEARVGLEQERLGLAVTKEQREAALALDKAERERLELEAEQALRDPESERSRAEQDAALTSVASMQHPDGTPVEITPEVESLIRRMPAEALTGPRSIVPNLFDVNAQEWAAHRAELMGRTRAEAQARAESAQIRREERAQQRTIESEQREVAREREEESRQTRTVGDASFGAFTVPGHLPEPTRTKIVGVVDARDKFLSMSDQLAREFSVMREHREGIISEEYREAKARADAIHSAMKIEYKNIAELGALSGPDMDLVLGAIGDAPSYANVVGDAFGVDTWETRLRTARNIAAEQASRIAANNGAEPVRREGGADGRPGGRSSASTGSSEQPRGRRNDAMASVPDGAREYRVLDARGNVKREWASVPDMPPDEQTRQLQAYLRQRPGYRLEYR